MFGDATLKSNPVIAVDYDPEWLHIFAMLKERVLRAVGDMAVAVEHVGSTAVPGLAT